MANRIVFWVPPNDLFPYANRPHSLSLDPTSLQSSYPDLAAEIGGARIVGHQLTWVGGGGVNWIMTFEVED
ncbi:hypothetical protein [Rhodococcus sp. MTM3W5.2]|uniref:hypothetical protein n=1 Tax=Rhodococcus sp. MTM3W5.2 TaxID=1805827 RepID=UPI00097C3ADE|nr:hypothetical protein [Rhodococcus sp. MTM3W5.2]